MTLTNRLIGEKSPYLQQHAHDPIDWYPWGQAAFDQAQTTDRPIFLSIGYATCHWCHAMQRESFSDPEVAKVINEIFVPILIDREELPELDSLYMELSQALMAAPGGWPLNVILTPDLKPFFAVTYLPAHNRQGLIGLVAFAKQIQELWKSDERNHIIGQAAKIVELFEQTEQSSGSSLPQSSQVTDAVEDLFAVVDPVYGGLKGEPKFPLSYMIDFLLAFSKTRDEGRALFFAEVTLDHLYRGGIYDLLGGGFSRYSMDAQWQIPHFEKMLYDNALLAKTYLEGYRLLGKREYRQVCEETLDFLLRDMLSKEGGIYSGLDADSEGKEGFFYTWSSQEIRDLLSEEEFTLFSSYYNVTAEGNFNGRNILHATLSLQEYADELALPKERLEESLLQAKKILYKNRQETRVFPFIDRKVLCSGNAFAIDVFSRAGALLGKEKYLQAAIAIAAMVKNELWSEGRLLRRFCDQQPAFRAGLDDYSALIKGLLSLYQATADSSYLRWALELNGVVQREFKAPKGAYYQTDGQEPILIRKCEFYDGAEPSSNGVHTENLVRLYQITQEEFYLTNAQEIMMASKEFVTQFPPGACYHLLAWLRYFDKKAQTLVVALNAQRAGEQEIRKLFFSRFLPHAEIVWRVEGDSECDALLSAHTDKIPVKGETALYLCTQDRCLPPVVGVEEITKVLQNL